MYSGTHHSGLNREVATLHSDHIIEVPLYCHNSLYMESPKKALCAYQKVIKFAWPYVCRYGSGMT